MTKDPKILFQICEEQLETGLRGFPVGYCTTSRVDPIEGLFYLEKPISELALMRPEEVIYFLTTRRFEKGEDFDQFCLQLMQRSHLSEKLKSYIYELPREAHPMKLFVMALEILGGLEGEGRYPEDCLNIVAKMPELVACVINHHAGWGKTPKGKPELGYMENFVHLLQFPKVQDEGKLIEVMKIFNILHYDHGGGNLSTFVGKAVASGLEDMYGSLAAAMCALAGPRHGRANQDCLEFVREIYDQVGIDASGEDVEQAVRKRLAEGGLVFGFGHAVLRAEDSRATVLYQVAQEFFPDNGLVKTALLLRERGPKVLKENPKIQNPYPNVDAMSGTLLSAAGFDFPEYFTVLFGLSRSIGIARQIVYERCEAREGKGTPIVRPKYLFKPN